MEKKHSFPTGTLTYATSRHVTDKNPVIGEEEARVMVGGTLPKHPFFQSLDKLITVCFHYNYPLI
jgi:hypothetical protein